MHKLHLLIGSSAKSETGQIQFSELETACPGWLFSYVTTGKDLLRCLELTGLPDVVIMSASLEDPGFFQTTLTLHNTHPRLPVIVITHHFSISIMRLAVIAGGIELMGWPAEKDVVETLVFKLINRNLINSTGKNFNKL
jgi:DNA-binding NtrC family response regulator